MLGIPKATVWYCRYGDKRAQPTDIWSNHIYSLFNTKGWHPRSECFNGNKKCQRIERFCNGDDSFNNF